MLEKDFRVLRGRCVVGIRIHHELGIGQVLLQEEGVDRDDDDVVVPMRNKARWRILPYLAYRSLQQAHRRLRRNGRKPRAVAARSHQIRHYRDR
jgi:hypothetical protein